MYKKLILRKHLILCLRVCGCVIVLIDIPLSDVNDNYNHSEKFKEMMYMFVV